RQEDIYFGAMSGQPPGVPPPATIPELVERAANGAYLRTLPTPPLMHGAAQWAAFAALHQGGAVVLQARPDRLDPDDIWGTVAREGVNLLLLVGDAFARPLLDGLDRRSYDLSRLFVILSGCAILSPHLKQALLERIPHAMVIDGFGASETGGHGAMSTRAGAEARTGTFAMAGTVVLREDLSGELPPGSPGGARGRTPRTRSSSSSPPATSPATSSRRPPSGSTRSRGARAASRTIAGPARAPLPRVASRLPSRRCRRPRAARARGRRTCPATHR